MMGVRTMWLSRKFTKNSMKKSRKKIFINLVTILLVIAGSNRLNAGTKSQQGAFGGNMEETITVPNRSVRYYGMMVKTVKSVSGRIFINDTETEQFEVSGSQISSNTPQCYLRVGENTLKIDIEVLEADSVKGENEALIKIDLHAMDEPDFPSDDNLFLQISWSPDKLAKKTYRFVLADNQKPVRTAICD